MGVVIRVFVFMEKSIYLTGLYFKTKPRLIHDVHHTIDYTLSKEISVRIAYQLMNQLDAKVEFRFRKSLNILILKHRNNSSC